MSELKNLAETLEQFAKISKKMRSLQEKRMSRSLGEGKYSKEDEVGYQKLHRKLVELMMGVRFTAVMTSRAMSSTFACRPVAGSASTSAALSSDTSGLTLSSSVNFRFRIVVSASAPVPDTGQLNGAFSQRRMTMRRFSALWAAFASKLVNSIRV